MSTDQPPKSPTVADRIQAAQERKGFDPSHDPKLQPSLVGVAEKWLAHWFELLRENPISAAGPLASLLADAVHEASNHERTRCAQKVLDFGRALEKASLTAAELAERHGFKPHGKDSLR